jgi:hypothetical protein
LEGQGLAETEPAPRQREKERKHPRLLLERGRKERLEAATWSVGTSDGTITGKSTDGEIVLALKRIVRVMKELAPLLVNEAGSH